MWFRIELHKDGSVSSCVEVEGSFKDSKSVHFVEADSKEAAIQWLKAKWERTAKQQREYGAKRREARKISGLCAWTGCEFNRAPGKSCCATHAEIMRVKSDAYNKRIRAGILTPKRTDEEKAAKAAERIQKSREWDRARKDRHLPYRYYWFRAIANRFDSMTPRAFRAWLSQEILALEAKGKKAA